jgi:adhesin/invasin
MRINRSAAVVGMTLVLAALNACGSDDSTGTFVQAKPSTLAITDGNGQTGFVTAPVGTDLQVSLTDANGLAVVGSPVVWTITGGGGTLSGDNVTTDTVTTDAYGVSTVSWTLGNTPGAQSVSAAVPGSTTLTGSFTATAVMPTVAIKSGNNQTAAAKDTVTDPLAVLVTDANGDPVENVRVDFAIASGGGFLGDSVQTLSAVTDDKGIASAVWVLGPTVGTQTVTAKVGSGTPLTFTAIATTPPPVAFNFDAATRTLLLADNRGLRLTAESTRAPFVERARG